MKQSLLKHLVVKYIPFILGMLGLVFAIFDLLIDKYAPEHYDKIILVLTMLLYIIVSSAFGVVLRKLFQTLLTDTLTGLYTMRYFYPRFAEVIIKTKENKKPISLLMIDADKFKDVNDTYGHMAGDYILKKIANIFKHSIRTNDTVVRWGGEEFLILLPDADMRDAADVAERIRNTVENTKFYYENNYIPMTLSIGVVTTDHEIDMKKLIKLTDQMLYRAKENRNFVKCLDCSDFYQDISI